jgi:uncharacterized iron-regulated protein
MADIIRKSVVVLIFSIVLIASACRSHDRGEYRVVRLRDGAVISFADMIGEVQGADFIFVGESHDNMEHHRLQLRIIRELHDRGLPLAVGFEMFRAGSQPELNRWLAGEMDQEDIMRLYYRDWGMPWPLYRDIMVFLGQENIPLLGLNIPRAISRKVARLGYASLTSEELAQLPPGLSCDVSPGYRQYIRKVFTNHASQEERAFHNFCEAQVLWDAAMAWHLVRYRNDNQGPVVVLSGMIHALKRGIPFRAEQMEGEYTSRVIVPQERDIDLQRIGPALADYMVLLD